MTRLQEVPEFSSRVCVPLFYSRHMFTEHSLNLSQDLNTIVSPRKPLSMEGDA